jgi:predicted nucleic acid-binding protein
MPARVVEELLADRCAGAIVAPMRPGLAWDAIRHTTARGRHGGTVYDSVIALAAHEAGASLLLTWNSRHFLSIAPHGLDVREP